ncbi:MAG TPA: ABC transporter substrate-binding protein [Chloroflexota bacterium]|nr:ABC transporter substrate-binding protein [Chloroflexota bacterium]
MAKLELTFACGDYDRMQALLDGSVQTEGVELHGQVIAPPNEMFGRMLLHEEFDASELSLSNYLMGLSQGDDRFVAIPVFPSRQFRHSYIWINTQARIREPKDLIGRRVGIPDYSMTALLYIRGLLQHEYGVRPRDVTWVRGRPEKAKLKLPEGIRVEDAPAGETLDSLLTSGRIDAIASASVPACFAQGAPNVARLIPNAREVEAEYFRRTGIFPIMHTVVIRRCVHEANPWLAGSLFAALEASKRAAYDRIHRAHGLYSLPWLEEDLEEVSDLFGGDPYPYGVEPNRRTLEAAVSYSHEQGLSDRLLSLDELFASV